MFIPCAFIAGITGQFFRQFALTIAVSTIISAINSLTLTPARAVAIFKHRRRRARPPQARGAAVVDLRVFGGWLPTSVAAALRGLPLASTTTRWLPWPMLLGAVHARRRRWRRRRLADHRADQRGSGRFFSGFNRGFDRVTDVYGRGVGRLVRLSVIVLLVYGGLLFLTYWRLPQSPTGFIPTQDQGYLLVERAAARLGVAPADAAR